MIRRQGVGCPGVCPLPMRPHPSLIHQLQGAKHRHVNIVHAPPGRRPCVEIGGHQYGVYARRLGMATCGAVWCGAAASDRRMEERELIDLADPRTDPCRLLLLWVRRRDLDCQAGWWCCLVVHKARQRVNRGQRGQALTAWISGQMRCCPFARHARQNHDNGPLKKRLKRPRHSRSGPDRCRDVHCRSRAVHQAHDKRPGPTP